MKYSALLKRILFCMLLLMVASCVDKATFGAPELICQNDLIANLSIKELTEFYSSETVQIQEDWIIEGYVISSDVAGNFFNVIHFQDERENPSIGLQIELELRDSHLFFEVGQKIFIKLKGLYLGESRGVYKIGGVFTSFGNRSVGRLPKTVVFDHIFSACDDNLEIVPKSVPVANLDTAEKNTLVTISDVEFSIEDLGKSFAEPQEETERNLIDCNDDTFIILNSGFSDFQDEVVPNGRGAITGVSSSEGLIIRDLTDLNFNLERCEDIVTEFTSNQILITEIADPDNNAGARFIEIYNSSDALLSLNGWQLLRYTNANLEISSSIDLSNYEIEAGGLLVISPKATEFEAVYGFAPDLAVGTNSPADSNGDDNLVLLDPFGAIIDIFGVIGEDGTNTNHEFEDGRAVRRLEVIEANSTFNPSEWEIFNDTGAAGTLNLPQIAPDDFSPGLR